MANLDSILKSRDITLPTKVCLVKAMVFPVVMNGCESWTIKKAECRRIEAFELVLEKTLETPTARRSKQSILKELSPDIHWKDCCWSWNSQYSGHLIKELTILKRPWCWERLKGGEGGRLQEEKRWQRIKMVGWHHWLDGHEFEQALGVGDGQGSLVCCSPWGHKESDTPEHLNWTELNWIMGW